MGQGSGAQRALTLTVLEHSNGRRLCKVALLPPLACSAVRFQTPWGAPSFLSLHRVSVHVPVDLLQQRVQSRVRLRLLNDLHQLRMLGDKLPQVRHFLKKFREEKGVVRVVALQVEFEHVHNPLLHFFNVSDVQKAWAICPQQREEDGVLGHHGNANDALRLRNHHPYCVRPFSPEASLPLHTVTLTK